MKNKAFISCSVLSVALVAAASFSAPLYAQQPQAGVHPKAEAERESGEVDADGTASSGSASATGATQVGAAGTATGVTRTVGSVAGGVQVTSSLPDSVVGDYKIDFGALDKDGNGALSRSEARANATLMAEFRAVDSNRDGRLSQDELKGWMD